MAMVLMVMVIVTGTALVGLTTLDGLKEQAAPVGSPVQESVTVLLKAPAAETINETGALVAPGATVTVLGEMGLRLKSTMCRVTGKMCVTRAGSIPEPLTMNK